MQPQEELAYQQQQEKQESPDRASSNCCSQLHHGMHQNIHQAIQVKNMNRDMKLKQEHEMCCLRRTSSNLLCMGLMGFAMV